MRRLLILVVTCAVALGFAAFATMSGGSGTASATPSGCHGGRKHCTPSPSPSPSTAPAPSPSPSPSPPVTTSGTVTKTLVVVEENHTLAQMQAGMPYLDSLASKYSYATHYTAVGHPSLPNYLALAAGSTFGITDDSNPASHLLAGATVFGQALNAGKTAKVYAEDEPSNCYPSNSGLYAVRHTAWPYFVDEATQCRANQVPSGEGTSGAFAKDAAAGTLPNVGWLIPNICNDAHKSGCNDPNAGSVTLADNWLKTMLPDVFNGPDWRSGHLAVVITADEDDGSGNNTVLTVVCHPSLSGKVVTTALTHYSLSRFLSSMSGSTGLHNAVSAPSFSAAFGLTTP